MWCSQGTLLSVVQSTVSEAHRCTLNWRVLPWWEIWCEQSPFYLCISAISARRRSISSFSEAICLRRNCSMASSSSCSVKISFSCNNQLVHLKPWLHVLREHRISVGWEAMRRRCSLKHLQQKRFACLLWTLIHQDLKANVSSKLTLSVLNPHRTIAVLNSCGDDAPRSGTFGCLFP